MAIARSLPSLLTRVAAEEGVPRLVGHAARRQPRPLVPQAVEVVRRLGVQPDRQVVPGGWMDGWVGGWKGDG